MGEKKRWLVGVLIGTPEVRRLSDRPKHRWEDNNNKMDPGK
jgi:hypothetical protein